MNSDTSLFILSEVYMEGENGAWGDMFYIFITTEQTRCRVHIQIQEKVRLNLSTFVYRTVS